MMPAARAKIAIITDRYDAFLSTWSLGRRLAEYWKEGGHEVVVVTPADPFVPADVALLHVDLTVVPEECVQLAARYPKVINGATLDIRKRRYTSGILEPGSDYAGPVIVKTDLNYGGMREYRRSMLQSAAGPVIRMTGRTEAIIDRMARLASKRSWRRRRVLISSEYPVFNSLRDVPDGVWENPGLLVQRYFIERAGDEYCCRHWLFFGSSEIHARIVSPNPVIKAAARIEVLDGPAPPALIALRRKLGFDYAKFDYGVIDGEVVLYDANRTTGFIDPRRSNGPQVLARGIVDFL